MGNTRQVESARLQGGLKALVTELSLAELVVMRAWVQQEIEAAKKPALRVLKPPPEVPIDKGQFDGRPAYELMGAVRQLIHSLPEDRLVLLYSWVLTRLREGYGVDR